ncbi:MAG: hypothetical protein RBT75_01505 [Anaerolineae bacterium]|jgi:predicted  nucleic acid-binding Zn-ribbon protein|nr:hypothetical protein [Anaerolineae bacterium]
MAWNRAVFRLQEIDTTLTAIKRLLGEIEDALKDDRTLREAQAQAKTTERAAAAARKAQKDLEFELQRVETERQQKESQLYGGSVHNARELQDLQAKVKSLRQHKAELEDALLDAMMAQEEATAIAEAAEVGLREADAEWQKSQAALKTERETLIARGKALAAEAVQVRQEIPPVILESYDYLQPRLGGISVAQLRDDDTCALCGVSVSAHPREAARAGEEAYCDGCDRLLVYFF